MSNDQIRLELMKKGVENLHEYGYPTASLENILTDQIFSRFFESMLRDNEGKMTPQVDAVIAEIRKEIEAQS